MPDPLLSRLVLECTNTLAPFDTPQLPSSAAETSAVVVLSRAWGITREARRGSSDGPPSDPCHLGLPADVHEALTDVVGQDQFGLLS